jgi:hypothetical protein
MGTEESGRGQTDIVDHGAETDGILAFGDTSVTVL